MKYRKLRIAWSVFFGILCLLLIALWVRSYWWVDNITCPTQRLVVLRSMIGTMSVNAYPQWLSKPGPSAREWERTSTKVTLLPRHPTPIEQWAFHHDQNNLFITWPYWFVVVLIAVLTGVPWIRWPKQFSLRTLLIAATVIAAVLGLAVMMLR
jgi:hypothetical protein